MTGIFFGRKCSDVMMFCKRHLWWLFAPVLAVLILAGTQFASSSRRQKTIHLIESLGGRVVTTHGDPAWLLWILGGRSLRVFEQATVVNLSQSNVRDDDLAQLRNLDGLERLNLNGTEITDAGMVHLARLTSLKALDLTGTQITGSGLEHLHGLVDLEYLYLAHTAVEDDDLEHLEGLTKLRHLDLEGTAVTPAAAKRILPHVEVIGP